MHVWRVCPILTTTVRSKIDPGEIRTDCLLREADQGGWPTDGNSAAADELDSLLVRRANPRHANSRLLTVSN